MFQIVTKRCNY